MPNVSCTSVSSSHAPFPYEHVYQTDKSTVILAPIGIGDGELSKTYPTTGTRELAIGTSAKHDEGSLRPKLPSIRALGLLRQSEGLIHEPLKVSVTQGRIYPHRYKGGYSLSCVELTARGLNSSDASLPRKERIASERPGSGLSINLSIIRDGCALLKVTQAWAKEEVLQLRRIVRFVCSYQGVTSIRVSVSSVLAQQETAGAAYVSCIHWPSRGGYYITSADIVRLVQYLLQRPVPPAERHRIRRNLAGIRSVLVSRYEPETLPLAETIESFESPKAVETPRSIKIFHWEDLEFALIHICKRYSLRLQF